MKPSLDTSKKPHNCQPWYLIRDFNHADICWEGKMAGQEELIRDMKVEESLDCSDCEIIDFKILR